MLGLAGGDIEDIIDDLEGKADIAGIAAQAGAAVLLRYFSRGVAATTTK